MTSINRASFFAEMNYNNPKNKVLEKNQKVNSSLKNDYKELKSTSLESILSNLSNGRESGVTASSNGSITSYTKTEGDQVVPASQPKTSTTSTNGR